MQTEAPSGAMIEILMKFVIFHTMLHVGVFLHEFGWTVGHYPKFDKRSVLESGSKGDKIRIEVYIVVLYTLVVVA